MDELATGNEVLQPGTEVHGLTADQVLTSEAFGLRTSRAESFVREMRKVSNDLQKGDRKKNALLSDILIKGAAALKGPVDAQIKPEPWMAKTAKMLEKLDLELEESGGRKQRVAKKKSAKKVKKKKK